MVSAVLVPTGRGSDSVSWPVLRCGPRGTSLKPGGAAMLHVKERLNGRNRGGQVNESWERELEWAAAAAAEQEEQAAISMARPIAIGAGLGVLVALAAVLPTLVGTSVIM